MISTLNASKIVVRTPFYPFTPHQLKEAFLTQLQSDTFKEALFLGSPNLYEEFEKTGNEMSSDTRLSLYKYFLRMSYRCTPFGMFSGVSSGTIGDFNSFTLPAYRFYSKHTRLDNHFINTFIQKVLKDRAVKRSLVWYTNNTIYSNGTDIRYVEYRLTQARRTHHLAKVETSSYLDTVLSLGKNGTTITQLVASILSDEITEDEATAFIDELIESKLLLSELEPIVTGKEPYKTLLTVLNKYESGKSYAQFLVKIVEQILLIESQPPGTEIEYYKGILKLVKEWDSLYDPKLVFQSDLSKVSPSMHISPAVLDEIEETITFLAVLNGQPNQPNLNNFKEEFTKRYEDKEVSLLEVLDTESGIGYPAGAHANNDQAPLLHGLFFNNSSSQAEYRVSTWQRKLMHLYQQCLIKGETELAITNDTFNIDKKLFNERVLPDSLATICSIQATEEEVKSNQFTIDYHGTNGPSAANLLGRFCYLNTSIQSIVEDLIHKEEQIYPDKIFAEVVHLAQARVGNVLIRPTLRKYEIPILTFSSVDNDHTILLEDIMVSVKSNRILLRSRRLNKEIVPRNTTAHNYSSDTVPYYYFLCDLQQQDNNARLSWDWGVLNEFKFLPRVKYGKVILSKARWVVDEKDLQASQKQNDSEFKNKVKQYQVNNKLQRFVVLSQGDNQLPLDLEDELCLSIVRQELLRNKRIVLEESLFNENNLVVSSPEGKFTNEIIIPWTKEKTINVVPLNDFKNHSNVPQTFIPGSEWHFIKIYCGVKTSDQILTDVIKSLADELQTKQIISQWFFIRYADPDYHLRVRFKGDKKFFVFVTEELNKRLSDYIQNNQVWKIQNDTYKRELERYGYENIENSELLFFHDSVASIEVLKLLEGDEGDELRWQFAIKGVNDILNNFGLDLEAKEKVMIMIRDGFKIEFKASDRESQKQLSEHYRKFRKEVELILSSELEEDHEYTEVWKIFKQRSINWSSTIKDIKQYINSEESKLTLNSLLGSYIHMFLNRFLRSKQRLHELVIYDFLCQFYRSTLAKEKLECANLKRKEVMQVNKLSSNKQNDPT